MQNTFGIKLDTANMTLEELEAARKEIRKILFDIEYQITLKKLNKNNHSSN